MPKATVRANAPAFADADDEKARVLQDYVDHCLIPLCRETHDDGLLAVALNGQIDEAELRAGQLPYLTEKAALCRFALGIVEARIRAKLDVAGRAP